MKNRFFRGTLAGLMWLACVSMLAQGTVDIFNGPGSEVDAPVYDVDGVTRLAGAAYQVQLFAGPAADQLVAVGAPLPFRSKYGAGYWQSGDTVLVINSVPPGAKAFVQIRVWEAAAGTTYEAAMAAGGKRGTSLVLSIVTGGGGAPPSLPPMLVGLESFRLFQGEPPKVVSQPQNQTVIAGNPASFEVVATGTEPVAYQWFKNGVAIPGAIGSQLFLSGVGPAQAGNYTVVVTDLVGTVTSSAAVLTVLGSPSITSQPVGLTAVAGTNVTLSATASGSAPLSYQWMKGGLAVAGGNGAQLTLNNVQPSQAGSYSVVVTNLAGTVTSSAAVVTVLVTPSITRQPVGLTVVAGTNATLSVTASGTGPLSYRWLKDGSAVAGGNSAQLALNNVQPSQAGSYAVVVTNLAGTVTSSAAAVTVLQATVDIYNGPGEVVDAPVYDVDGLTLLVGAAYQAQLFAGPAADQLVAVGAPLPFRTNLGAGYWQSGDTLRVINSVLPGATAFVQIRVWEVAAGATYEAAVAARGKRGTSLVLSIVTGGAGAPPSLPPMMVGLESFRLFQEQPPKVVSQPLNQTVIAGNPAGFEVVATGTEPVAYQWFENEVAIYGAIGPQLLLSGVWPDQLGSYYVRVFNVAGVVTSDTAFLTVLVPPSITSQPVGLTVVAGTNVTLRVTASGSDPLSYQWKKDGSTVAGGNDSQLALNTVQSSQAGSYTVVVTNLAGTVTSSAAVVTVNQLMAGVGLDGYIAHATVFFDANRNGVRDANEPFTQTDGQGQFSLPINLAEFDLNHNGKLDPEEGCLVMTGGLDIATGLPLRTPMTAPAGSGVVTPLTTLLQAVLDQSPGMSVSQAQARLTTSLGLSNQVDLTQYDALAGARTNDPAAGSVLRAAAQVQDTMVQVTALLAGASTNQSSDPIARQIAGIMAGQVRSNAVLNLSQPGEVSGLITQAMALAGTPLAPGVVAGASAVIAQANQLTDAVLATGASGLQTAEEISRIQGVVQGSLASEWLQVGAQTRVIDDVLVANAGDGLQQKVQVAPVGNVTGTDTRAGTFAFGQSTFRIIEDGTPETAMTAVTVVRTQGNKGSAGVRIALSDGTARLAAGDYLKTNVDLLFNDGEISQTLELKGVLVDDNLVEGNETLNLTLALATNAPSGALLGQQTAVVTVVDNDLPGAFSFSASEYRVKEDGTALSSVLVTRTGGSSGTVTVVVTPGELAGGATAGLDYVAAPISVTFEPGNFHRYVTVPVLADTVPEGAEAIALSLSLGGGNPPGTSLGVQTNALLWIEDDAPVVLSARLEPMAAPAGAINLRIHGPAGKRFVVQKSLDLHQWTGVHTNRLMGAAADYSETQPPPAKENRFYRLLLMP